MKKVLITLDYSATTQKMAETGFKLAKSLQADIILMHVIADPIYYSSVDFSPIMGFTGYFDFSQFQTTLEELEEVSQKFLDKAKHHLGDDTIKTLIKHGDVADSILEAAKEAHADVIVMDSHGRTWLDQILMGSVTEKVLHHSTIPLFIIPTKK